jgi:hypothetical protein
MGLRIRVFNERGNVVAEIIVYGRGRIAVEPVIEDKMPVKAKRGKTFSLKNYGRIC